MQMSKFHEVGNLPLKGKANQEGGLEGNSCRIKLSTKQALQDPNIPFSQWNLDYDTMTPIPCNLMSFGSGWTVWVTKVAKR